MRRCGLAFAAAALAVGAVLLGYGQGRAAAVVPRGVPSMRVSAIRGVTYVEPRPFVEYAAELIAALPEMQAVGFNTVELVLPWMQFEPAPLARPPLYENVAFTALQQVLAALDAHGMHALIMLNMLGPGWSPAGIDACTWYRNRAMEGAFESYVAGFLQRIEPYHDLVYPMVVTESTQYCDPQQYSHSKMLATMLQRSIGSLPARLPATLRWEFRLGYQDNTLIALNWAKGVSPIASPDPFNFISSTVYGLEQDTNAEIDADLTARVGRFKAFDPRVPLVFGEFGASRCYGTADNQARVELEISTWAIAHGVGFNVWHWKPSLLEDTCLVKAYPALAITNLDGSLTPAGVALKNLLNPTAP